MSFRPQGEILSFRHVTSDGFLASLEMTSCWDFLRGHHAWPKINEIRLWQSEASLCSRTGNPAFVCESLRLNPLISSPQLIFPHHPIVLTQGWRKVVGAVIFRHKVQVRFLGRIKNGHNWSSARIGNRPRWQASDPVSVVRTHGFEIPPGQVPVKTLNAVDNRRIAL